ncbi:MAG: glycerol-3-phosphate dehydrogenase/oxidase [bacterium]|jgi:glycerol-3-phosphate dehydrogenase|nr:glycerol-3-phosphate dehydrogenase/oxidase [candidate division KSB1 bacterium]MDH7560614.1 glycerol-3-phosphate dehydrogenase/oxidase [bacterium]
MKRDLNALAATEFDILIIGGGIYGATVAWEAALRGLSVALVERGDFASGTSASSLKIIHGGLRYLQHLDIKRVRESVRERCILLAIAPHLVHPLPCVMPTYGHLMKGKEVMRLGLLANDLFSFDRNRLADPDKWIPAGRVISRKQVLELLPGIDPAGVTGGACWTDAQMYNSERMTLAFLLSAASQGAQLANYVEAVWLASDKGVVRGVHARDVLSGDTLDVRARLVVNAAGGWANELLAASGLPPVPFQLSTAMNIIVRKRLLNGYAAGVYGNFTYPTPGGRTHAGRHVLFMAPWRGYTIIGTFHRPYLDGKVRLQATEQELEQFLTEVNSAYPGGAISRDDIVFVHKGFLPMDGVTGKTGEVQLTKHYRLVDHARLGGPEGLLTVIGVKYTTARDVAEKTVNLAAKKLGKAKDGGRSRTTPLVGGHIPRFSSFLEDAVAHASGGLSPSLVRHLVMNYGSDCARLLAYGQESAELLSPFPGSQVLGAEVVHAAREEMACKLSDAVLRRTELGSAEYPGDEAVKGCARLMAKELGWPARRAEREVEDMKRGYPMPHAVP